ncbi:MAG: hemin uptake protein HemP [Proteobacteria bacterium]|nr:MAG: hemin uptake protein HemP [Pseudomonadota bacterium]
MTADTQPERPVATTPQPSTDARGTAHIASESLLKGRSTVTIEHKGVNYRLQETRAGKLILTK